MSLGRRASSAASRWIAGHARRISADGRYESNKLRDAPHAGPFGATSVDAVGCTAANVGVLPSSTFGSWSRLVAQKIDLKEVLASYILTWSCHWVAKADKRQWALLLPIKCDKPGKTEAPATAKRRRA
jgi:hypothetical protein